MEKIRYGELKSSNVKGAPEILPSPEPRSYPAYRVCEMLADLELNAEDLALVVDKKFERIARPNEPTENCEHIPDEVWPAYFNELRSLICHLETSLSNIRNTIDRVDL